MYMSPWCGIRWVCLSLYSSSCQFWSPSSSGDWASPDHLKNPSLDFGNALVLDHCFVNSNPSNVVASSSPRIDAGDRASTSNDQGIGNSGRYFMRSSPPVQNDNAGTGHDVDPPTPRTAAPIGLESGSGPDPPMLLMRTSPRWIHWHHRLFQVAIHLQISYHVTLGFSKHVVSVLILTSSYDVKTGRS